VPKNMLHNIDEIRSVVTVTVKYDSYGLMYVTVATLTIKYDRVEQMSNVSREGLPSSHRCASGRRLSLRIEVPYFFHVCADGLQEIVIEIMELRTDERPFVREPDVPYRCLDGLHV